MLLEKYALLCERFFIKNDRKVLDKKSKATPKTE